MNPAPQSPNDRPMAYGTAPASQNSNKKRNITIAVIVAIILIACICLIALGAAGYFSGFFDRLMGRGDTASVAMPEDTEIYFGVNLLNATPDKLNRIIAPFSKAFRSSGTDIRSSDDALQELDSQMMKTMGISFSEDVKPWVGQYIGIGLSDIRGGGSTPSITIAIEVRDKKAADEFAEKLKKGMQRANSYISFDKEEYEGVTLYVSDQNTAFARSKSLFLISDNTANLQDAIDAQSGESLAKDADYKALLKELPASRLVTIYMSGDPLRRSVRDISGLGYPANYVDSLEDVNYMAASLAIVDAGLQMDTITAYELDGMDPDKLDMLKAVGKTTQAMKMLPEDTLMFVAGNHIDATWNSLKLSLIGMGNRSDFDEAMSQAESQIGFNPDKDLLLNLDGEFAIAVMPSRDGLISKEANLNLGVVGIFGYSEPGSLQDAISSFIEKGNSQMQTSFDERKVEGASIYASQEPEFAFGLSRNYLGLATSADLLSDVYSGKSTFVDSAHYKQMMNAIPSGSGPVAYWDISGSFEWLQQLPGSSYQEYEDVLRPLEYLVISVRPLNGHTVRNSLLLAIEQPEK